MIDSSSEAFKKQKFRYDSRRHSLIDNPWDNESRRVIVEEERNLPYKGFRELRPLVLERDNYKCQKCGAERGLMVHHIDGNKFNNTMENLVTSCYSCHNSLRGRKVRKGGNKQTEKWRTNYYAQKRLREQNKHSYKHKSQRELNQF